MMAGDKSSKPAKQSKAVVEDKQLKEDVKNFAAQLGLSGAGGAGFEGAFDDFKPELAQKKLGHRGDKGPDKPTKGPFKTPDKPADNHQERQQRKQQQPEQQKQQQQNGVRSSGGKAGTAGHGDRTYGSKQQQQQNGVAKPGQQQQQQRQLSQGGHGKGGQPDKQDWQASVAAGQLCVKSILPRDEPAIWHEAAALLPTLPDSGGREAEPALVQAKKAAAEQLLQREEQAFEQSMGRRGEQDLRWLQQAKRSGTTQDKVAAMSVLVQESAVANLRSLDGLITMCAKTQGGRGVVGATMDALRELFTTVLLPDRKLRFFEQQPLGALGPGKEGERQLLYLLVEDAVKKKYAHFVDVLDACSRDNLDFVKDKAVKTMYELLSKKAEGEQRLLSSLVNKLGDPDRKLASKVGYLLTRLLAEHPGMKSVVVREIERFVFRPGLADRARYYCVVYLNQMVLGHRDSTGGAVLARRLVDLYFTLFKMTLDGKIGTAASLAKQKEEKAAERGKKGKKDGKKGGKKGGKGKAPAPTPAPAQPGELDARMLSALITGVRRAFPFVAPEDVEPLIEAHADALFKLIHTRSFGVATQALLLLFQLMTSRSSVSDRFYRAMYSALESPELTRSTKAPMFLSLLFKALQADVSHKRVSAFAKRILQVAQEAPANFACGCLLLLSELMKARPALWNAVLQPEDNERGEERFVDADVAVSDAGPGSGIAASDAKAVGASVAAAAEHESVPGVSSKHGRGKGKALVARIDVGGESDAQEEEAMLEESDAEGTSEAEEDDPQQQQEQQQQQRRQQHLLPRLQKLEAATNPSGWPGSKEGYDMRKREPQFAGAERVCHWELASLAQHVHPSVAAMARTLLAGASVVYGGDPLRDLTLGAFLDKFVQKKAKAGERGGSLMQPLALQQQQQQGTAGTAARGQGVLSAAFAVLSERDVAPDTLFFHKYYSLAAVQSKLAGKKRKKAGDDMAELLSDESEEEDAIEDFLAGEEAGGDEGIGADPDRSTDFDYNDLAAAMDDEEDGGEGSSGAEEEPYSGIQESDSDAESLDGAQFSDLSGSEGEEEGDGTGSDSEGSPGLEDDDDESLAVSEDESSGGDTADEDAEVEALLTKRGLLRPGGKAAKKRKGSSARAESESDSLDSQVNPFELAEATDSEGEIEQQQEHQQKQRRRLQEGEKRLYGKDGEGAAARGKQKRARRERGAGAFGASAFASADDYAALIDRAEREEHAGGAGGEGGRQGKRRPGDTAGKRQRHG